jgi:lipopolysaccharide assembly outer membrane protein LptD (OstA)
MFRNRWLLVAAFAAFSCLALSQETGGRKFLRIPSQSGSQSFSASATNISREEKYPSSVHLSGDVEIIVPMCYRAAPGEPLSCPSEMALTGDSVVVHEDTGEIEATGSVRVIPSRPLR